MVLDLILDHFFHIQVLVEGKKVTIFGVDYSSSVDTDNNEEDIPVLVESPTQGLDDTTIPAEARYFINFSRSNKNICLSLHCNGSNSFQFVNVINYQFKAKYFEIKLYPLYLRNISKDLTANNMKKKRIKWICIRFLCWLWYDIKYLTKNTI